MKPLEADYIKRDIEKVLDFHSNTKCFEKAPSYEESVRIEFLEELSFFAKGRSGEDLKFKIESMLRDLKNI